MRFANGRIVLVTVMCERCGIDVASAGLCDDCIDVTGAPIADRSTVIQREQSKEWVEMGIPLKEVARELGFDRSTVQHWITDANWSRFFWADAKGVSNKVKARFH